MNCEPALAAIDGNVLARCLGGSPKTIYDLRRPTSSSACRRLTSPMDGPPNVVSLHSSGCIGSVPLACRSLEGRRGWAREDLSHQRLPFIAITRNATEALPWSGNALSLTKLKDVDRGSFIGRFECPLLVR
jgi:hypothetical protein